MAKITKVQLKSIPKTINVGDYINDITVIVDLEFHELDVSLKMEYLMYVYVYDIHGNMDVPVIISNWDDSKVISVSEDGRKDDFLGKKVVAVSTTGEHTTFEVPMALKLGHLSGYSSSVSRKFEVLATLIPATGRVSKWSQPFESELLF